VEEQLRRFSTNNVKTLEFPFSKKSIQESSKTRKKREKRLLDKSIRQRRRKEGVGELPKTLGEKY